MHFTRRCPNWGVIKNILIVILVVLEIATFMAFNNKYSKLQRDNMDLESIINNQLSIIQGLNVKNNDLDKRNNELNNQTSDLNDKNNDLNNQLLQLEESNEQLLNENEKLLEEKTKLENEISSLKTQSSTDHRDFKSYMGYTAITNKASKQWMLQTQATTDEDGIRCIDGRPLVAVGTGWGLSVGDYATVTCANGNSFDVVIGDIKDDKHTLADNKTTASNGCRCEFIVDMDNLNSSVKKRGSVAILQKYSGYVVDIK